MNKSYFLMAIVVASTMMLGFAYAERSTVEVPFAFHGHSCTFDEQEVKYHCTWEGSSETVTKEVRTEAGVIPEDQLAEERKTEHDIAKAIQDKPDKKTEQELLIERLADKIDKDRATPADKELYRLMKAVQETCYFGIEEGRLIQNYDAFEIPSIDMQRWGNYDYNTNNALGKIVKLLEACKGWSSYKAMMLGQQYLDIEKDDSTSQLFHSDIAEGKETYPSQKLTKESFEGSIDQAEAWICSSSFYDYEFKKSHNCYPVEINEAGGIDPCEGNLVCSAYYNYLKDGYADLSKMKKQEAIRALSSTADSFAEEQGIDKADLKNWLAEQREKHGGQK